MQNLITQEYACATISIVEEDGPERQGFAGLRQWNQTNAVRTKPLLLGLFDVVVITCTDIGWEVPGYPCLR